MESPYSDQSESVWFDDCSVPMIFSRLVLSFLGQFRIYGPSVLALPVLILFVVDTVARARPELGGAYKLCLCVCLIFPIWFQWEKRRKIWNFCYSGVVLVNLDRAKLKDF